MKFLAWHLGLGDAIAFADLAVKLADGEQMLVPCYAHNEVSVRSIFVNHPNIQVETWHVGAHGMDPRHKEGVVHLGHYSGIPRKEGEDMIEWVYRTAGMLPEFRFDAQVVAKAAQVPPWQYITGPAILVHQDHKRGFSTNSRHIPLGNVEYVNSAGGKTILAWSKAVETAAEIHCIDSAFLHLVEQLQPTGKLYYHKYARPGSEAYRTLRHNWTVIE